MALTVIVGGQYGSEGKGKLASYLACTDPRGIASVRSGGSNAGHTAYRDGRAFRLRQLPCGVVSGASRLYLAAGMVVDPIVLHREMHELAVDPRRLMIDRNAVVMCPGHGLAERNDGLRERIGSTVRSMKSRICRRWRGLYSSNFVTSVSTTGASSGWYPIA